MSTVPSPGMSVPMASALPNANTVSVKALSLQTRNTLSCLLNMQKIIPNEKGLPRDWRGLAHLVGIRAEKILTLAYETDPTAKVLALWQKQENMSCSVQQLLDFLGELDRFDAVDDTALMIEEDIRVYLTLPINEATPQTPVHDSDHHILTIDDVSRLNQGLDTQNYDAFVVFADEDIDFATELIETMEKQYGLKLCVKERDLVAGLPFEHKAIIELISERCNRLIVIISPAYVKSSANKFVVNFAQALGIEQGKRKIIPCLYERCELPQELRHYFMLDYSRSGKLWNFWDKLKDSIQAPPASPTPRQQKAPVQQVQISNHKPHPELKSALVHHDGHHTKHKKESVKFGSLSNLTVIEPIESKRSVSTNELSSEVAAASSVVTNPQPESKPLKQKNWLQRLLHQKEVSKKKNEETSKDKKKKFRLRTKVKVPVPE